MFYVRLSVCLSVFFSFFLSLFTQTLSQLFKDPECWSGRGLNPRPPAQQPGTELTGRRLCVYLLILRRDVLMFRIPDISQCVNNYFETEES